LPLVLTGSPSTNIEIVLSDFAHPYLGFICRNNPDVGVNKFRYRILCPGTDSLSRQTDRFDLEFACVLSSFLCHSSCGSLIFEQKLKFNAFGNSGCTGVPPIWWTQG
jgi:hypothetical protein